MRNNKDFGLPDSLLDAVRQVVEKKLDPVDSKELKGKHADRKDKDIDNDGDVDSTDKFLHRRRKAITKAIATKEAMQKPYVSSDRDGHHVMTGSGKISKSFKDTKSAAAHLKKNFTKLQKEDVQESRRRAGPMKSIFSKSKSDKDLAKEIEAYAKKHGGIDKADFMKAAQMLAKGQRSNAIKFAKKLDTDPRDWLLDKLDEAVSPAQQAAIAIAKKKAGTKPKNEGAMSRMAYQKQSGEKGSGMKTFKPKPKEPVDVKPKMEASELPKK